MTDTQLRGPVSSPRTADRAQTSAEIELEIQRTRARMTENVDALAWKVSPERLKARVRHKINETQEAVVEKVRHTAHEVGDQARQAGSGLFGTLKENPIPAAMIGAGIAWLIIGRRGSHEAEATADSYGRYYDPAGYVPADTAVTGTAAPYGTGATAGGGIHATERDESDESDRSLADRTADVRERASEKAAHARDRISETASNARDRISETASDARDTVREKAGVAREKASELGHGAADRARRTRGWAEQQMEDNPLVVGAAVLALGAAVGSLVPTTRKEDELLGPQRDQLMDRARSTVRDAREVVGVTARETIRSAKDEAAMQKGTVRDAAADLSSELQTSARKVVHDAKETARSEAEQRNLV